MEKQYELIALFAPKMNDIMAEKTVVDLVKAAKFKVIEVDKWGIKPLAYPIKKETKAYYLRLVVAGGNAGVLLTSLKIEETLLRYLLVVMLPAKKGTTGAGKETK